MTGLAVHCLSDELREQCIVSPGFWPGAASFHKAIKSLFLVAVLLLLVLSADGGTLTVQAAHYAKG